MSLIVPSGWSSEHAPGTTQAGSMHQSPSSARLYSNDPGGQLRSVPHGSTKRVSPIRVSSHALNKLMRQAALSATMTHPVARRRVVPVESVMSCIPYAHPGLRVAKTQRLNAFCTEKPSRTACRRYGARSRSKPSRSSGAAIYKERRQVENAPNSGFTIENETRIRSPECRLREPAGARRAYAGHQESPSENQGCNRPLSAQA